jgi:hypothetical protein
MLNERIAHGQARLEAIVQSVHILRVLVGLVVSNAPFGMTMGRPSRCDTSA